MTISVKGLILRIPNVIKAISLKSGTCIEYAENGRRMYTFGKNTRPYKAGFTQMEVSTLPYNGLRVSMLRDGQQIMQASKVFSPKANRMVFGEGDNPFRAIANFIRERCSR